MSDAYVKQQRTPSSSLLELFSAGRNARMHLPDRAHTANRDYLRAIEPTDSGEAILHMADGTGLPCSRRQLPIVRQALGSG